MYIKTNKNKYNIKLAKSFFQRLTGFIGEKNINSGILFPKCNSIHTYFMKEHIDIIAIDENNEVIYKYENLGKNKIISKCKECFSDTITEYVITKMNKIYERLDLVKKENQTISINSSTTPNTTNTENISTDNETESSFGMFDNIGGKIKTLAQVVTWIGIIASVISGIVLMSIAEEMIFVGLMVMIFGALMSWVSSFVLYGFGQLVENSDKLVKMSKK